MANIFKNLYHKAKIGTLGTIIGAISLFGLHEKVQSQDFSHIVLSGTGYSLPFNDHPVNNVKVFSKPDNTFLGSTTTDPATGNYSIGFWPVGQQEHKYNKNEMKVLGNPVATDANLELMVLNQNNYTIRVFDAMGKELYNQKVNLSDGNNKITLTGLGPAGFKIVNVTNGAESYTSKIIQTENTDFSPSISATATTGGQLKMSLDDLITDSLYVQFIPVDPVHYTGMDTTIVAVTNPNLNYVDEQIPNYTINLILNPFDVLGNHANVSLTISWADSTINYTQSADNKIHINKKLYVPNPVGIIKLDTNVNAKYTSMVVFQELNKAIGDTNVFQSPKESGTATTNNPAQPGPLNFADTSVNYKTLNAFFFNKKVPDPLGAPGDSIRTDSRPVREMMSTRNGGVKTLKYIDVDGVTPFYKLQLAYDPFNDVPIPAAQTDRQKTLSEMTDNMSPIPGSGVKIFTDATFHFVQNKNDAILQLCQTRNDQYTYMYFVSGTGYPGNVVVAKLTPDGKIRASVGSIQDTQNDTDGIVFAEYYKGKTTVTDPSNTSASPYIWSSTINGPTVLAYWMADALGILNLNTKYF